MKNITKEIKLIFSKSLGISINEIKNTLSYVKSDKWDSLNHMKIVAQIEKKYKIQLKMTDIIAMETFGKSINIINKYLKKK
jgi:acyl carrier protein